MDKFEEQIQIVEESVIGQSFVDWILEGQA